MARGGGGERKRMKLGQGRGEEEPATWGETKIGDASFHMTSGDVMKMDGQPRRSA